MTDAASAGHHASERAGRLLQQQSGPDGYAAFIPAPLPPAPPLDLSGRLSGLLERASSSLGRLDGISRGIEPDRLLYMYIRKEAVLSSQIEDTQSTLAELLESENDEATGIPVDDIQMERFIREGSATPIVKAGLVHAQFETIHPFLDGNGRLGRLLITMILCAERALAQPCLYLSLYLKQHRDDYYRTSRDHRAKLRSTVRLRSPTRDHQPNGRLVMFSRFTHAIVRPPARNFADGLTTVTLGAPDVDLALAAHARYCAALERHGCALITLAADERYPDSTFVEDTALIIPGRGAILARPGAASRAGEVDAIHDAVSQFFPSAPQIAASGTLDAGDVCEAGTHVFIGISHRTNADGARQLGQWLATFGITSSTVDIRNTPGILHLKSGVCAIEPNRLVAIEVLADHEAFTGYDVVRVVAGEEYAANCLRVNDVVFVADGFPQTHATLRALGYTLEVLDMREFAKMDGGLSCLSLRF